MGKETALTGVLPRSNMKVYFCKILTKERMRTSSVAMIVIC